MSEGESAAPTPPDAAAGRAARATSVGRGEAAVGGAGPIRPVGLRALDAFHLAAAAHLGPTRVLFVTWDRRLAGAALRLGLAVAPARLG